MYNDTKNLATVNLPLTGLKPLYRSNQGKTLVFEIELADLKRVNEPTTIDEMVAEARLEYFSGKTKGFSDTKKLMSYLKR